jgi:hypothetical protein
VRTEATSDLWWKNAVVYCVDVKTFQDSNGDGIGDLAAAGGRADPHPQQCPELGFGHWRLLETDQDRVLAHGAEWAGGRVVALHNLAGTGCRVKADLPAGAVEQLVADRREAPLPAPGAPIPLEPYGWRWLRLHPR